jgi:hypothetical protein
MYNSVVWLRRILYVFFVVYLLWWAYMFFSGIQEGAIVDNWTDTYGIIAAIGGIGGLIAAKHWGGWKSYFGRSMSLLSVGLFFQFLGQLSYAIYARVYHVENPYPSFGEFFYYGSFPIFIYAMITMGKALGISIGLKPWKKIGMWIIPSIFAIISWFFFLQGYEFTKEDLLLDIYNFSYPLIEAIYLGFTGIAFLYSFQSLGGKLRPYVSLVFLSMLASYFSNSYFMYEDINGMWRPSGISDLVYFITYFLMGLAFMSFNEAYKKVQD